jgi:hypothetical protein
VPLSLPGAHDMRSTNDNSPIPFPEQEERHRTAHLVVVHRLHRPRRSAATPALPAVGASWRAAARLVGGAHAAIKGLGFRF